MVNGINQLEQRSVRRRLVQSTLFVPKSPEIGPKVDHKDQFSDLYFLSRFCLPISSFLTIFQAIFSLFDNIECLIGVGKVEQGG
ncbi:hypothetical protein COLO4_24560 [Corchorus olitorius]|uniref:Uncharacterized protein n=1 Tax=Corchorus olitorius TaxID=93759 RepID=A0A1R3I933_9ROSI|nr:hypothetical protein COLO4_24560 [Corchorus olitorius]